MSETTAPDPATPPDETQPPAGDSGNAPIPPAADPAPPATEAPADPAPAEPQASDPIPPAVTEPAPAAATPLAPAPTLAEVAAEMHALNDAQQAQIDAGHAEVAALEVTEQTVEQRLADLEARLAFVADCLGTIGRVTGLRFED